MIIDTVSDQDSFGEYFKRMKSLLSDKQCIYLRKVDFGFKLLPYMQFLVKREYLFKWVCVIPC